MLAMAAVAATLDGLVEDGLMPRAEALFARLAEGLAAIPGVVAVRGRGGLVGVELDRPAKPVLDALRARGVLAGGADPPRTLRLMPPLTTTDAEADACLAALAGALGDTAAA
jgi:acetylornithine/succinyldiaminopimelate/putrescine aminotransferase